MTLNLVSKKNPFLVVVLGDLNAKLSQWHDKDSSTPEGISVENVKSQFGLHEIINEPTHILKNSSLRIDLIFTSQTNLSGESGIQPSAYFNCDHQIIYAKFNLQVFYPSPYTRKNSNVDLIRWSVNEFHLDRDFANKYVEVKFRFSMKLF